MSWLVTLPQNLNDKDLQEKRKFFEKSYEFLKARYGAENVISAYVHMDEAQPHMHFAWTPVLFDEKKQAYRFNAKVVGSRNDLQTFHDQFDTYMTQQMGYVTGVRNGITEINMSINELKAIQKKMSKIDEQIAQNALRASERVNSATNRMMSIFISNIMKTSRNGFIWLLRANQYYRRQMKDWKLNSKRLNYPIQQNPESN